MISCNKSLLEPSSLSFFMWENVFNFFFIFEVCILNDYFSFSILKEPFQCLLDSTGFFFIRCQPSFLLLYSFFFFLIYYFWLCWVFVAACRLSLVAAAGATLPCGARASHCGGLSCSGAWALGARASLVAARGLKLLRGMWDLPGAGLEPVSPALAGGFLTTAPPGKPLIIVFLNVCVLFL